MLSKGHALLGQAYLLLGEPQLARESLEKALDLDPQRFEAQRALATLDFGEGHTDKAKSRLEAILRQTPQDTESLGLLLNLLAVEEDWTLASTMLTQLRQHGMDSFEADMTEGRLYQARKLWKQAEASYTRALETRPNNPAPLLALIRMDLEQERP